MKENSLELLPLEQWLSSKQHLKDKFPLRNGNYFNRYISIKNWLEENIYHGIGAATSADDGGIYTDHGPRHFNAVINYAGKLLGLHDNQDDIKADPYEVYLILTSILLHDAGNIEGRIEHEKKPFAILTKMGSLATTDVFERRLISDIAEVHGGETKDGNKDTIGSKKWEDSRNYLGIVYRPNMIAAIVRFADEICEDRGRAIKHLVEEDRLPKKSEVFQHYAYAINTVSIDRLDKSIKIEFIIEKKNVCRKFGKKDEEVYLIDEIMSRLEKMNNERMYCSRFMYEIIQLQKIKASITIVDETYSELKKEEFPLGDTGYPSQSTSLANKYPDWVGNKLEKFFKRQRSV